MLIAEIRRKLPSLDDLDPDDPEAIELIRAMSVTITDEKHTRLWRASQAPRKPKPGALDQSGGHSQGTPPRRH